MNKNNIEPSTIKAPYPIFKEKDRDCFYFKVNATEYNIAFIQSNLLGVLPYDSICIDRDLKDNKGNKEVANTLTIIIKNILDKDRVLCFICDTTDGRQIARQKLFKTWFKTKKNSSQYVMLSIESDDIYGGIILKKSHPLYSEYLTEMENFKKEMTDSKPHILFETF